MAISVRVKYVFGVGRREGGTEQVVELASPMTLFELLQKLGLADLELLTAVNGTSVADSAVLEDGDEVVLIPAIQGGAAC